MSADGKTLRLELFFEGAAVGADCASGAVGAKTIKVGGNAFTGNATQVYTISAQ
jgi:nitrous oxidase accessory protein NosD